MDKLYQALEKTLAYAGFFNYPITVNELSRMLISARVYSTENIQEALKKKRLKPHLKKWLVADLTPTRIRRQKISQTKFQEARLVAQKISWLPTIKMIAVTGSLAVQNTTLNSDIDLMIVTRANTLWMTRPLVTLLVALQFKRRIPGKNNQKNAVCLNLWLDTQALAVPEIQRNVYTAHEVLQLVPIYEQGNTYQRFLRVNSWVRHFMAGAYAAKRVVGKSPRIIRPPRVKVVHWWATLNRFCFYLQYWYMKPRMTRETVNLHAAYFHPKNWSTDLERALNTTNLPAVSL